MGTEWSTSWLPEIENEHQRNTMGRAPRPLVVYEVSLIMTDRPGLVIRWSAVNSAQRSGRGLPRLSIPRTGKERSNWRRRMPVPTLFALPSAHAILAEVWRKRDKLNRFH
jgi:hypothetical protein